MNAFYSEGLNVKERHYNVTNVTRSTSNKRCSLNRIVPTKILRSTKVFGIDNNNKCVLSTKSAY